MRLSHLFTALLTAFLLGCHSQKVPTPIATPAADDCMKSIRARYAGMTNRKDSAMVRQMQAELARCANPQLTLAQAACIGAVYADYGDLAYQLAKGKLTPAQWLQRSRDRTRKLDRYLKDPAWSEQLATGDADQDLVPDSQDRCPNTPRWAATDDAGCPLAEPPPGEGQSPEDVRKFFGLHVLLPNARCEDAPPPTVPTVRMATSIEWPSGLRPRFSLELEEVVNQPAGCPVVYECILEEIVPLRLDNPAQPPRMPQRLRMVFNPAKGRRSGANVVFEKEHPRMTFFFHQTCHVKVRAVNGNGTSSPWTQQIRVGQR